MNNNIVKYIYDDQLQLIERDSLNNILAVYNRVPSAPHGIGGLISNHDGTNTFYTYDPFGRRIKKDVNGQITNYIHDGDQIIAEYDSGGTLTKKFVYGPRIDEPIKGLSPQGTVPEWYYHFDGLGSVTDITDSSGAVVERYSYDIYGKVIIKDSNNNIISQSLVANPYFFTARELDPETGLYYYRARYYSPLIGRFLQTDPVGYSAGINLYTYCSNNPINYIDPMGLDKKLSDEELIKKLNEAVQNGDRKETSKLVKELASRIAGNVVDQAIVETSILQALMGQAGRNVDQDKRFIDTEKLGTIDLQHVVSAAVGPPFAATVGGLIVETLQSISDPESAFKTEDIVSNTLGGVASKLSQERGTSIGTEVRNIIRNAGPKGLPY